MASFARYPTQRDLFETLIVAQMDNKFFFFMEPFSSLYSLLSCSQEVLSASYPEPAKKPIHILTYYLRSILMLFFRLRPGLASYLWHWDFPHKMLHDTHFHLPRPLHRFTWSGEENKSTTAQVLVA
jgi:hypothetical protein